MSVRRGFGAAPEDLRRGLGIRVDGGEEAGAGVGVGSVLVSRNGVCAANMLGHVCDGIVNGKDAYGGGTVMPKDDSIDIGGDEPYPSP